MTCLLLGVISTWAVAWGLAMWRPHVGLTSARYYSFNSNDGVTWFDALEVRGPGVCRRSFQVRRFEVGSHNVGFGPLFLDSLEQRTQRTASVPSRRPAWGVYAAGKQLLNEDADTMEDARGWPFLSQWCEIKLDYQLDFASRTDPSVVPLIHAGGILVDAIKPNQFDLSDTRMLPCRPIWPGFLANSAFYAGAWFLLLGGRRSVRTWIRARRGLCPACAYDLRATPGACPECGWGVPASR